MLGYDIDPAGGRLIVNEDEADRVREIFGVCEEAGSLVAGLREVDRRGLLTKTWTTKSGKQYIGKPFRAHTLAALLSNVLYKGSVRHNRIRGRAQSDRRLERMGEGEPKASSAGAKQRDLGHG